MSSSSEGLRDERRICRIGWTILACGSPTSHMRPLAMDDALPLLIALSAGATAMMVRPRFTMIDVLGALWGRVGRQGSERQGTCQAKGWRCAVLLFRVVNSRSCVVKPVVKTTKRVETREHGSTPEPSAPDASPMRCRCTRERFATVPAARPAPMCSSLCRLRVPEYFGASAFWDCMCTVWDCPPGQKKCLPCRAAAPVNRLRLSPHDSRPRTGQRPPAVADTAF